MEKNLIYSPDQLERLLDSMTQSYSNVMFDLNMLESTTKISRSRIYEILKINFGLSPWDFVEKLRLNKAILYFKESHFSITTIGYKVGYYNSKSFRNLIKRRLGYSPSGLMKTIQVSDNLEQVIISIWIDSDSLEKDILVYYLHEKILPSISGYKNAESSLITSAV